MGYLVTSRHRDELIKKGVTVIDDVLTEEEADRYRSICADWVKEFPEFPMSYRSLIQRYRVGHMEPAWAVRLKSKKVFSEIWGTEQLLSSFDAIAIGRPPEEGEEDFHVEDRHWLHIDQGPERAGLHGYQGAVYLETCDADDWAFEVIEGSHEYHETYHEKLGEIAYYTEDLGLKRTRVPVKKGGMVIWDSRLIHANSRPIKGRGHPGRWRYVVFVCMTPAKWADDESLQKRRQAYKSMQMTTHWPSTGVSVFPDDPEHQHPKNPNPLKKLPPSACTVQAKQLAGVIPYDGAEDNCVMDAPKWRKEFMPKARRHGMDIGYFSKVLFVLVAIAACVVTYWCL